VVLYNTIGQNVYEFNFTESDIYNNQLQININTVAKGLYNGSVEVNHQSLFFKFVKESD
jgi:hypothetical protein